MPKRHRYRPGLRRRREKHERAAITGDPLANLVDWCNSDRPEQAARTIALGFRLINERCNEILRVLR